MPDRCRLPATLAFALAAPLLPTARAASAQAPDSHSMYQVHAVRVEQGPTLDGRLDDAAWESAAVIDQFVQQEPDEGAPATERTEVRLVYDAETLYLGVRAFDSPDGVTATEMRRDSDRILDEDNFQIILDTFMDSRSGYMFVTNPLGAQLDQQVSNEGEGGRGGRNSSNINRDWDGVWDVVARRDERGWVAEIAIPMVTLRFPASETQSWGMNLMRNIGRKNEQSFWAPIPKAYTITRVSMAGSLDDLSSLNRGSDFRATPFVTGGASRSSDSGQIDRNYPREVGLDVKYGVTAGLNLDLTLNTDFAQAEVDDEQVNLTRFPLFYPEKRDFFLENAGQFNVGSVNGTNRIADLFFTRQIGLSGRDNPVPIIGGARLTGKVGRNDVAVMNVQTESAYGRSGENFLVTRYSRNFASRSRVGGLFVNRAETDGSHYNRTYALDVSLAPHPRFTISGFVAKTETPGVASTDTVTTATGTEYYHRGNLGAYINATWLDESWRVYGEWADLEANFNPEVGFVPRTDIRTSKWHLEYNPRPGRWGIRSMSPMINLTYTTDQRNRLVSRRMHYMIGTAFENGANLTVWYNRYFERLDSPYSFRGVPVAVGDYSFGEWRFSFGSNRARRVYYQLNYSPQTFYDGDRTDASVSLGARLSDRLSTQAQYSRNDVTLSQGDFVLNLASLRVDLAMSPTISLRSIAQYNSSEDQWGVSARFRWTYRPGSDIYLVYDELQQDPAGPTFASERQILLKVTHLLSR